MEHSYSGLTELISQDAQARAYFMSLPDYVQGMIQQRNDNVRTAVAELQKTLPMVKWLGSYPM